MTPSATARARGGMLRPSAIRPTRWQLLGVIVVLVVAFVVAESCQESQIRLTKEQAIATAEREVDFEPDITNVKLLRQGIASKAYWFVNLSTRRGADEPPTRLVVVQIDANTGKVIDVKRQR